MARETFQVEVLTPEGSVFDDEVEMISTRTHTGSLGVLANHAPLMGMLEPCELRLYKSGSEGATRESASGDVLRFAQGEGYLQVVDNSALVLVEDAVPPEEIDRSAIESRLKEAQDALGRAEEDSEERARLEREIRRHEVFLEVAGSS
jgi:F-type H+-transporting ATPase subunit epsilon